MTTKNCGSRAKETLILFAVAIVALSFGRAAESRSPKAEVTGVVGVATAQPAGGPEEQLRAGTTFSAGTIIRTASGAAVDLSLGNDAGMIRLAQNTKLIIEQLQRTNSHSEIYLYLQHGTILGNGAMVHAGSRYHIKTLTGIAAIGNAAFRLQTAGYFVVVEGKAQFAHVIGNEVKLHSLSAPPPVYFSPSEGDVKSAPKQLVREVGTQLKAKLTLKERE
jgi:hypothetical protein